MVDWGQRSNDWKAEITADLGEVRALRFPWDFFALGKDGKLATEHYNSHDIGSKTAVDDRRGSPKSSVSFDERGDSRDRS